MSSGQSLRNGSSVEPGLPNTRLMPNARNRLKVASLTVAVVARAVLVDLRDDIGRLPLGFFYVPPWPLSEGGSDPPSRWIILRSQATGAGGALVQVRGAMLAVEAGGSRKISARSRVR